MKFKNKYIGRILLLLFLFIFFFKFPFYCLSQKPSSNVTLNNGNFVIGYTDVIFDMGLKMKIERIYNSKSSENSLFGIGWGFDYATKVLMGPKGDIIIKENGSGATNEFFPTFKVNQDSLRVKSMIALIQFQAASIKDSVLQKQKYDSLFSQYSSHYSSLLDNWTHYYNIINDSINFYFQTESLYRSEKYNHEFVKLIDNGFLRKKSNGIEEIFDKKGILVEIRRNLDCSFIKLQYFSDGKLRIMEDNFNNNLYFVYNNNGNLEHIITKNSKNIFKLITYVYNNSGNLIYNKDIEGNIYKYEYDQRYNMTQVSYTDRQPLKIEYYDSKPLDNVKSIIRTNGENDYFFYNRDSIEMNMHSTTANVYGLKNDRNDTVFLKSQYITYTDSIESYKIKTINEDSIGTDTIVFNKVGQAVYKNEHKVISKLTYDIDQRLLKRIAGDSTFMYTYNNRGLLGTMTIIFKNKTVWDVKFEYDSLNRPVGFDVNRPRKFSMKVKRMHCGLVEEILYEKGDYIKLDYDNNIIKRIYLNRIPHPIEFSYDSNDRIIDTRDPSHIGFKLTNRIAELNALLDFSIINNNISCYCN